MNVKYLLCVFLLSCFAINAQSVVESPDGKLKVSLVIESGQPMYSVSFNENTMLENSPLGLITNEGDFSKSMSFISSVTGKVNKTYTQEKIKQSEITYEANTLTYTIEKADKKQLSILFQVSNNDIAFRYEIPKWGETYACVVQKEATGLKFPKITKSFLSYMMSPMGGFARTAPSYESGYVADSEMETNTAKEGYVFPGLFRVGDRGWALVSETGVSSQYCASHLSSYINGVYVFEIK